MENNKTNPEKPWGISLNTFCLLMHLSILFFFPLSLIMWVKNKDNNEVIDSHGKNVVNFLISYSIYIMAGLYFMFIWFVSSYFLPQHDDLLMIFVLIGFGIWLIVEALFVIFTIIAAIKAGKGEIYKYPLTIEIIK